MTEKPYYSSRRRWPHYLLCIIVWSVRVCAISALSCTHAARIKGPLTRAWQNADGKRHSRAESHRCGGLRKDRATLNKISDLLHTPVGAHGDSPFRAIAEIIGMIGKGHTPPYIPLDELEKIGPAQLETGTQAIARNVAALEEIVIQRCILTGGARL